MWLQVIGTLLVAYSFVGLSEGSRYSLGEIYGSALAGTVNAGPVFDAFSQPNFQALNVDLAYKLASSKSLSRTLSYRTISTSCSSQSCPVLN